MSVKPLNYEIKDLGKYMKSREHRIELEYSLLSGKRKIIEDGKVLFEGAQVLGAAFQFPFTVDGNNLNIIQQGESFELRINNQVFTHLWQQEKTKSEFQYEDEVSKKDNQENNFGFGKNEDKWSTNTFGTAEKKPDEKMKFSINLNFSKKETKKTDDVKFTGPSQFESSQMTNSMPFPQDFANFSKTTKKNNNDYDFGTFDFNKFGQHPEQKNETHSAETKFPETNFANLGKFSIPALKKPPSGTSINQNQGPTAMTQSTAILKSNNIDLLDLMDEPAKKEEKSEGQQQNTNWDPFSQDTVGSSPILSNSVKFPAQPQLFDFVFTGQLGTNEEKTENDPNKNTNTNLQDVFNNPKQKEAEERVKKLSLLDNAFGPSYNMAPAGHQMIGGNMGNMNMMYFSQPSLFNQNMNPNFVAQNAFPMATNVNMFPMQTFNNPGFNHQMMPTQGFSNPVNTYNNNGQSTPFDQFK